MSYKLVRSETVYRGRVFDVRRDKVELPNGIRTELDIVAHGSAVVVLPLDAEGNIWFIRQYRHASGQTLLELAAGGLEQGEAPELCAHRELREETGLAAADMRLLGGFYLAPGYSSEYLYVYLARELHPSPLPGDVDEIIEVDSMPLQEFYACARGGSVQDAKTLAALLLAEPHLT